MGNHNSKAEQLHYDPKDWQEVERSTFYEVMRSNKGQQGNLYHFNIKSHRDIEDQIELYFKRRSAANWVQVLGANLTSSGFGFCGSQENALVITERIPYLLGEIPRLNKQDSLVVLYNALRGYNDISRIIVPGSLTNRMIGFTSEGQTKVWINENFGMNYPNHFIEDAVLDEHLVVNNLVNAITSKTELNPDFVNTLKASRTFNTAIGFIRSNGGVAENILEANRINVASYAQGQVPALRDTTPIVQPQVPQYQGISAGYVPSQQFSYQPQQVPSYQQPWAPQQSGFNQANYRSTQSQFITGGSGNNLAGTAPYQPTQISYQPNRI